MTAEARTYRLHGLNIRTCHELPAAIVDGEPDIVVSDLPARAPTTELPRGEIVAASPEFFTAVSDSDGHTLRYHGWYDFHLDASMTQLTCQPHDTTSPGFELVLLEASVLAWVLALRGCSTIHASAVSLREGGLAIGGPSNAGKTSIATLACVGGARMISDDVVRISLDGTPRCHRGTSELRVREEVRHLADLPGLTRRMTADDRIGATATLVEADEIPLRAIVLPAEAPEAELTVLPGAEALTELLALARLLWAPGPPQRRHFADMVKLARAVPVVRVAAPWRRMIGASDFTMATELLSEVR